MDVNYFSMLCRLRLQIVLRLQIISEKSHAASRHLFYFHNHREFAESVNDWWLRFGPYLMCLVVNTVLIEHWNSKISDISKFINKRYFWLLYLSIWKHPPICSICCRISAFVRRLFFSTCLGSIMSIFGLLGVVSADKYHF